MATANSTGLPTDNTKPLAADAMLDLCKFIDATKENRSALKVWDGYIKQARPVIEVSTKEDGTPLFFLSKSLASFISNEVAA